MVTVAEIDEKMHKTVWGKRSLSIGEVVGFIIAGLLIWFKWLGKWSVIVGLAVLFICCAFF